MKLIEFISSINERRDDQVHRKMMKHIATLFIERAQNGNLRQGYIRDASGEYWNGEKVPVGYITGDDVGIDELRKIAVAVLALPELANDDHGMGGFLMTMNTSETNLPKHISHMLAYFGDDTKGPTLAVAIKKDPLTFIHEMVHYDDLVRSEFKVKPSGVAHKNPAEYFNSSTEINAYFTELAHMLDSTSDEFFDRPFDEFMKHVLANKGMFWYKWLNDANKKRVIKRAYALWQDRRR